MNPDDRGTYLEGLTGEMTYLNAPDSFKCKICFPCENVAAILIKAVLCQFYFLLLSPTRYLSCLVVLPAAAKI